MAQRRACWAAPPQQVLQGRTWKLSKEPLTFFSCCVRLACTARHCGLLQPLAARPWPPPLPLLRLNPSCSVQAPYFSSSIATAKKQSRARAVVVACACCTYCLMLCIKVIAGCRPQFCGLGVAWYIPQLDVALTMSHVAVSTHCMPIPVSKQGISQSAHTASISCWGLEHRAAGARAAARDNSSAAKAMCRGLLCAACRMMAAAILLKFGCRHPRRECSDERLSKAMRWECPLRGLSTQSHRVSARRAQTLDSETGTCLHGRAS